MLQVSATPKNLSLTAKIVFKDDSDRVAAYCKPLYVRVPFILRISRA